MPATHLDTLKTCSATLLKAALLIAVQRGLLAALPANLMCINTSLSALQRSAVAAQA